MFTLNLAFNISSHILVVPADTVLPYIIQTRARSVLISVFTVGHQKLHVV